MAGLLWVKILLHLTCFFFFFLIMPQVVFIPDWCWDQISVGSDHLLQDFLFFLLLKKILYDSVCVFGLIVFLQNDSSWCWWWVRIFTSKVLYVCTVILYFSSVLCVFPLLSFNILLVHEKVQSSFSRQLNLPSLVGHFKLHQSKWKIWLHQINDWSV